jgi:Xaa-Pro aminopeptidase
VIEGQSLPCGMKAIKNPVEMDGIRRMHVRDGAALVRWLQWLDQQVGEGNLDEVSAADKLEEFRSQLDFYQGLSFHTIAGYGANSAIGHYQSNPMNAPVLHPRGIFLVDSGAQYLDGTSDITRTLSLGQASAEEKQAFTQVLKCHIRLATARFPKGTKGIQLDAVAREPLWRQGWNCRHGIGHGVGCFLNVHEGPPRFNETNLTELEAGMVLSNEPGVYFEGRFGIRIENILITVPAENSGFGAFLKFETVSLCPIDLDLVEPALLAAEETAWLNAYHRRVRDSLTPLLNEEEKRWLWRETREI